MSELRMRKGWNPKQLGVKRSEHSPHETDVWLYLSTARTLDIVIQVNEKGAHKGQTAYKVRVPR